MPRRRKRIVEEAVEVEEDEENIPETVSQHPIHAIVFNAQQNESFHSKYIRELQLQYSKNGHDVFMHMFIGMLHKLMQFPNTNSYANVGLHFLAKYVTSYNGDDTHPVFTDSFKWLLGHCSLNQIVRFRMCEFVNLILNSLGMEAALDDSICDDILKYMLDRLKDISANVREQAINALQRLQVPENPNDPILRIYQFHLLSDPSAAVRQAVITAIGRNFHTIPYIMERLWDHDEKVRRHTYLQMSSYPVRAYKVAQRLTFLEQGLNDHSEIVKKVVTSVLLPQWFDSYEKNCVLFLTGLKLDANDDEIQRFRKTGKQALLSIFKKQDPSKLIEQLSFITEYEFDKCIPVEKLTIENSLYWISLLEFFQQNTEFNEEIDNILPELSTFCNYILKYSQSINQPDTDKWKKLNQQYILFTLTEILLTFDLADEIGRNTLKKNIYEILITVTIHESTIINLVKCIENLMPQQENRLQFFVEVGQEIIDPNINLNSTKDLIDPNILTVLEKQNDPNLLVKIYSLKCRIMELKEQETDLLNVKDYVRASNVNEELSVANEELLNLTAPYINSSVSDESTTNTSLRLPSALEAKRTTNDTIIKCLQILYYAVASKHVTSLTPSMAKLYKDFIRRHIESTHMLIRDWALKCGTAFSMLYDLLAKDVYNELYVQFYRHQNPQIWGTAIRALFDLIDRYGFDYFSSGDDTDIDKKKEKSKKAGRQLYNTLEYSDVEDQADSSKSAGNSLNLMYLFGHIMDTCADVKLIVPLIDGFCRLILRDHYNTQDLISKLLLKYFNPVTEPLINQILGIFFKQLVLRKKQDCLQPALLPTLFTILEASKESPLLEIKPQTVIKFIVNLTKPIYCDPGVNIHNKIASSFLEIMMDNQNNKELLKLLSKELLTLEVSDDKTIRDELKLTLEKLINLHLDVKSEALMKSFMQILEGTFQGELAFSSTRFTTDALNGDTVPNADEYDADGPDMITEIPETITEIPENIDEIPKLSSDVNNSKIENLIDSKISEVKIDEIIDDNILNNSKNETKSEIDEDEKNEEENQLRQETQATDTTMVSTTNATNDVEEAVNATILSEVDTIILTNNIDTNSVTILTPTTFGPDNSTKVRYLRKSMHARQQSVEDDISSPPELIAIDQTQQKSTPAKESHRLNRKSRTIEQNITSTDSEEIPPTEPRAPLRNFAKYVSSTYLGNQTSPDLTTLHDSQTPKEGRFRPMVPTKLLKIGEIIDDNILNNSKNETKSEIDEDEKNEEENQLRQETQATDTTMVSTTNATNDVEEAVNATILSEVDTIILTNNIDTNSVTILTPTTFGPDNSTKVRYLRKSMHARQQSVEDDISSPPKLIAIDQTQQKSTPAKESHRFNRKSRTIEQNITSTDSEEIPPTEPRTPLRKYTKYVSSTYLGNQTSPDLPTLHDSQTPKEGRFRPMVPTRLFHASVRLHRNNDNGVSAKSMSKSASASSLADNLKKRHNINKGGVDKSDKSTSKTSKKRNKSITSVNVTSPVKQTHVHRSENPTRYQTRNSQNINDGRNQNINVSLATTPSNVISNKNSVAHSAQQLRPSNTSVSLSVNKISEKNCNNIKERSKSLVNTSEIDTNTHNTRTRGVSLTTLSHKSKINNQNNSSKLLEINTSNNNRTLSSSSTVIKSTTRTTTIVTPTKTRSKSSSSTAENVASKNFKTPGKDLLKQRSSSKNSSGRVSKMSTRSLETNLTRSKTRNRKLFF